MEFFKSLSDKKSSDNKNQKKNKDKDEDETNYDIKKINEMEDNLHISSQDPWLAVPLIANFILFSSLLQTKINLNEDVNESSIINNKNKPLGEIANLRLREEDETETLFNTDTGYNNLKLDMMAFIQEIQDRYEEGSLKCLYVQDSESNNSMIKLQSFRDSLPKAMKDLEIRRLPLTFFISGSRIDGQSIFYHGVVDYIEFIEVSTDVYNMRIVVLDSSLSDKTMSFEKKFVILVNMQSSSEFMIKVYEPDPKKPKEEPLYSDVHVTGFGLLLSDTPQDATYDHSVSFYQLGFKPDEMNHNSLIWMHPQWHMLSVLRHVTLLGSHFKWKLLDFKELPMITKDKDGNDVQFPLTGLSTGPIAMRYQYVLEPDSESFLLPLQIDIKDNGPDSEDVIVSEELLLGSYFVHRVNLLTTAKMPTDALFCNIPIIGLGFEVTHPRLGEKVWINMSAQIDLEEKDAGSLHSPDADIYWSIKTNNEGEVFYGGDEEHSQNFEFSLRVLSRERIKSDKILPKRFPTSSWEYSPFTSTRTNQPSSLDPAELMKYRGNNPIENINQLTIEKTSPEITFTPSSDTRLLLICAVLFLILFSAVYFWKSPLGPDSIQFYRSMIQLVSIVSVISLVILGIIFLYIGINLRQDETKGVSTYVISPEIETMFSNIDSITNAIILLNFFGLMLTSFITTRINSMHSQSSYSGLFFLYNMLLMCNGIRKMQLNMSSKTSDTILITSMTLLTLGFGIGAMGWFQRRLLEVSFLISKSNNGYPAILHGLLSPPDPLFTALLFIAGAVTVWFAISRKQELIVCQDYATDIVIAQKALAIAENTKQEPFMNIQEDHTNEMGRKALIQMYKDDIKRLESRTDTCKATDTGGGSDKAQKFARDTLLATAGAICIVLILWPRLYKSFVRRRMSTPGIIGKVGLGHLPQLRHTPHKRVSKYVWSHLPINIKTYDKLDTLKYLTVRFLIVLFLIGVVVVCVTTVQRKQNRDKIVKTPKGPGGVCTDLDKRLISFSVLNADGFTNEIACRRSMLENEKQARGCSHTTSEIFFNMFILGTALSSITPLLLHNPPLLHQHTSVIGQIKFTIFALLLSYAMIMSVDPQNLEWYYNYNAKQYYSNLLRPVEDYQKYCDPAQK